MTDELISRRLFLSTAAAAPAVPAFFGTAAAAPPPTSFFSSDRIAVFTPPPEHIRICSIATSYAAPPTMFSPAEVQQIESQGNALMSLAEVFCLCGRRREAAVAE